MSKALLITGATGKQGSAVINALLGANANLELVALTRNAQSASAQKLQAKSKSIQLITGDLNNIDDVFKKAKKSTENSIWGVFSVQVAIGDGATPQIEEKQGKALIDASIENGVRHFVYSSVDRGGSRSDTDATSVPHFASKHRIEQHLFKSAEGKMDWTVLRPVAFYENLVPGFLGKVFATSWDMTLGKEQKLQLVATSDIGFFATEAFTKPDEYKSQKISLAGDELTYIQFKNIFTEKTGQNLPTTFRFVAGGINMMVKDLGLMFKWFRDVGYGADIPKLKEMNPELKDFGTWLEKESQFKTC
ncbi:nucleoside-diphosphate-sugar epimerase family protein [Lizonia empirigonia]|nr:nucleoside-diphosphate-sugar epimerase family protein [Lizonia empirigonia]